MKNFAYYSPSTVDEATSILARHRGTAWVMAGGTDLLSRFKNDITYHTPPSVDHVVDIAGLPLNYVRFDEAQGLRIGATTPVSTFEEQIRASPSVRTRYGLLADAARDVAAPQIRNMATVGGDILQEVWCWYVRYDYDCWRNGGTVCYGAIGDNRYYHSIFGGRLCYAVHASDLAPALYAMRASVTVASPRGPKTVPIEALIPGISIVDGRVKENILSYDELVTEIQVPTPAPNSRGVWVKARMRQSWDFALAAAAVHAAFDGGVVRDSRIILGGVDVKPRRALAAEAALNGSRIEPGLVDRVAEAAVQDATPLEHNAFRIDITKGVVKKALHALA